MAGGYPAPLSIASIQIDSDDGLDTEAQVAQHIQSLSYLLQLVQTMNENNVQQSPINVPFICLACTIISCACRGGLHGGLAPNCQQVVIRRKKRAN